MEWFRCRCFVCIFRFLGWRLLFPSYSLQYHRPLQLFDGCLQDREEQVLCRSIFKDDWMLRNTPFRSTVLYHSIWRVSGTQYFFSVFFSSISFFYLFMHFVSSVTCLTIVLEIGSTKQPRHYHSVLQGPSSIYAVFAIKIPMNQQATLSITYSWSFLPLSSLSYSTRPWTRSCPLTWVVYINFM